MASHWKKEWVDFLIKNWPTHSARKLADRMSVEFGFSVSRNAIIGQARRQKLWKLAVTTKPKKPHPKHRPLPKPKMLVAVKAPPLETEPLPPEEILVPLAKEIKSGRCAYAYGDDLPYLFCGRAGYPWCNHHRSIVFYRRPEWRSRS